MKTHLKALLAIVMTAIMTVTYTGVAKAATLPTAEEATISYMTHVQDIGNTSYVGNGYISGTTGQNKKIEALTINASNLPEDATLKYSVNIGNGEGWKEYSAGEQAGTTGHNTPLYGLKIDLDAKGYNIIYRLHIQDYGWLAWVENGEETGVEGKKIEALQILLVKDSSKEVAELTKQLETANAAQEVAEKMLATLKEKLNVADPNNSELDIDKQLDAVIAAKMTADDLLDTLKTELKVTEYSDIEEALTKALADKEKAEGILNNLKETLKVDDIDKIESAVDAILQENSDLDDAKTELEGTISNLKSTLGIDEDADIEEELAAYVEAKEAADSAVEELEGQIADITDQLNDALELEDEDALDIDEALDAVITAKQEAEGRLNDLKAQLNEELGIENEEDELEVEEALDEILEAKERQATVVEEIKDAIIDALNLEEDEDFDADELEIEELAGLLDEIIDARDTAEGSLDDIKAAIIDELGLEEELDEEELANLDIDELLSDLIAAKQDAESKVEELQSDLDDAQKANEDLSAQLEASEEENEKLADRNTVLQGIIDDINEQIAEELNLTEVDEDKISEKLGEIITAKGEADSVLDELRKTLEADDNDDIETKLDAIIEAKSELNDQIDRIKVALDEEYPEYADEDKDSLDVEEELDIVLTYKAELEDLVNGLKDRLLDEETIADIEDLDDLSEKFDEALSAKEAAADFVEELKDSLGIKLEEDADIDDMINAIEDEIDEILSDKADLEDLKADLKKALNTAFPEGINDEIDDQLDAFIEAKAEADKAVKELTAQLEDAEKQNDDLTAKNEGLKADLAKANDENAKLADEKADLQKELDELKAAKAAVDKELATAEAKNAADMTAIREYVKGEIEKLIDSNKYANATGAEAKKQEIINSINEKETAAEVIALIKDGNDVTTWTTVATGSELDTLIKRINDTYKESDYSVESWKALSDALNVENTITEEQAKAKIDEITKAEEDLVRVVAYVTSEKEMNDAIANEDITKIVITESFEANFEGKSTTDKTNYPQFVISRPLVIDGQNNTITSKFDITGWAHNYIIQVFNTEDVTISNLTLTGGEAAILVNSSKVTVSNIDVLNNELGGIEVSVGGGENVNQFSELTVAGAIKNTTETYGNPIIWEDGVNTHRDVLKVNITAEGATYTSIDYASDTINGINDQIQYYIEANNAKKPAVEADVTALKELYTKIDSEINKGIYTEETVNKLKAAKEAADKVSETNTYQEDVVAKTKILTEALENENLVKDNADYSKVTAAKEAAEAKLATVIEGTEESVYTAESVKAVNDAIAAVVEGKKADEQEVVNGYATAINDAINNLVFANKADLQALIEDIDERIANPNYTGRSKAAVSTILEPIKDNKDEAGEYAIYKTSYKEIADTIDKLKEAKKTLVLKAYSTLDNLLDKAWDVIFDDADKYTEASMNDLRDAVALPELDNDECQDAVLIDKKIKAIESAIAGLKYDAATPEGLTAALTAANEDSSKAVSLSIDENTTLTEELTLPSNVTLTVPAGTTLTIAGALNNDNGGTIVNKGTIIVDEVFTGSATNEEGAVLQVNTEIEANLKSAIKNTSVTDIKLKDDLEIENQSASTKNGKIALYTTSDKTINLDNHELNTNLEFAVYNAKKLTIKNGTINQAATTVASSRETSSYCVYNTGNITLEDVIMTQTNEGKYTCLVATAANATAVIDGGTYKNSNGYWGIQTSGANSKTTITGKAYIETYGQAICGNGSAGSAGDTVILDDCTVISTNDCAIFHPSNGEMTIKNAVVRGMTGIDILGGTLTIENSEISGTLNPFSDKITKTGDGSIVSGDAIFVRCHEAYAKGGTTLAITLTNATLQSADGYGLRITQPTSNPGVTTVNVNCDAATTFNTTESDKTWTIDDSVDSVTITINQDDTQIYPVSTPATDSEGEGEGSSEGGE